jgi:hypothetical protein
VEIPVPPPPRLSNGGTQEGKVSAPLEERVQAVRLKMRQIPSSQGRAVMGRELKVPKHRNLHCQEKPLARGEVPVPQTDTGRQGEHPKTLGKTLVKELGKMTP